MSRNPGDLARAFRDTKRHLGDHRPRQTIPAEFVRAYNSSVLDKAYDRIHKGPMIHVDSRRPSMEAACRDIDRLGALEYLRRRFANWTKDVEIRR